MLDTRAGCFTVIVNSAAAASVSDVFSSESAAVYVYRVAATGAAGVPDSVRVEESNVTPSGGSGDSEYVSGALPPFPAGSTTGSIARPASHSRASNSPASSGTVSTSSSSTVTVTTFTTPS